jgi:hypothetical protein
MHALIIHPYICINVYVHVCIYMQVVSTLRNVLLSRGFVEYIDGVHIPHTCHFQWKTTRYTDNESIGTAEEQAGGRAKDVQFRQRINHFQKTSR